MVRSDHLSNSKNGGVCIYYNKAVPLKVINVNYNYLNEYIRCECVVIRTR